MTMVITPQGHGLGWIPDVPDQRDKFFESETSLQRLTAAPIPKQVDLRAQCSPVYNQGQLGSCTANALAAAFDFDRHKEGKSFMTPSRLFIYWNERDLEGTVSSDAGAAIRDGVKVLRRIGTPPEVDWPYDITKFTEKPSENCFEIAEKNEALTYMRIRRPDANKTFYMQACLASGYPFVAGFSVYESFESPEVVKTGIVPMPQPGEKLLGGHAIVVVGYDVDKSWFIVRNSWGDDWGDHGYFYMPFAYLTNEQLSSDFWLIKTVEV
jgi:C1A family cysteine protease